MPYFSKFNRTRICEKKLELSAIASVFHTGLIRKQQGHRMTFNSSDEDTSYHAIKRGTTCSGLRRRTNNDDLPHRKCSLEKGGSEGREGKKATKSHQKKVGRTPLPTGTALITH